MKMDNLLDSRVPAFLIEKGANIPGNAVELYCEHFRELVEMERQYEMSQYEEEIRRLSGKEREGKGRALLDMKGKDDGEELGGFLVKFTKMKRGEQIGETEISVGDLVMISRDDPLRDDNPTGTVTEKTNYSITAVFDKKPHSFVYGKGIRIDFYVNDVTFQRMKDAIGIFQNASGRLRELREILLGKKAPQIAEKIIRTQIYDNELNESQVSAVEKAISSPDLFLIHGPPGTGKTTTLIEVIRQFVNRGEKVLATADSNIAVDNMVDFLADSEVEVLRVGHPARIVDALKEHTLDYVIEDNTKYQEYLNLREKAFALKDKQDRYIYPAQKYRRGMSNSYIKKLARKNGSARGVPPHKIRKMAEWIKLQEKADDLFQEAEKLRDEAVNEVIKSADVICTTNSTAGSEIMSGRHFDVGIIDEATQSTEPSCLIPAVHVDKIIMAGDHLQLPPTIQSYRAAREGLSVTLFERLINRFDESIREILKVQYRMHEKIMDFSNGEFYNGVLIADESVRRHTLEGLNFREEKVDNDLRYFLSPKEPVVFLDTSRIDAPERKRPGSTSRENRKECALVVRIVENLITGGIKPEDIAVISPYDDQVDLIDRKIDAGRLEIKTVDGFQGREKEVVVISLVRSNLDGEVGFLKDERRLNVSLTRARRKLIVIGDTDTLTSLNVYQNLVKYTEKDGLLKTIGPEITGKVPD